MALKLGKGLAFVKSRLKRLPQDGDVWEADFLREVAYRMGMVIEVRLDKRDTRFCSGKLIHYLSKVNVGL